MAVYRLPMIDCAVCKQAVRKVVISDDLDRQEKVFRVECHGATDECRLPYSFLASLTEVEMQTAKAVAFQSKPGIPHLKDSS